MNRENAKNNISVNCGTGWLTLVDIVYDNKPEHITITAAFQKWGGLKFDFAGKDEDFEYLLSTIHHISEHLCEKCGKSGRLAIIDGWETTLCEEDFAAVETIQKFRSQK